MLAQSSTPSVIYRFPFLFGIAISMAIGVLVVADLYLDPQGKVTGPIVHFLTGWMSSNPGNRSIEWYLLFFGAIALCLAYRMWKDGLLPDFLKETWYSTLGRFIKFGRNRDAEK